jgi:REP element-mobilizing transposase RayT
MEFYRRKFDLKVLLYVIMPDVIMPDHFHWAILPSVENFKLFREDQVRHRKKYHQYPERYYLSKIMEDFERHIAFVINERVGIRGRPVWQEGFVAKRVENRPAFGALADYIHHNPVKAGLVEKPEDYKFSSFRSLYLDDHSVFRVDANEF